MDSEALKVTGECHQERDWEAVGAKVSGLPDHRTGADRSITGEHYPVQESGTPTLAKLPERNQPRATGSMAALYSRLVELLPAGGVASTDLRSGGMDPATHSKILLAEVARLARQTESATAVGSARPSPASSA